MPLSHPLQAADQHPQAGGVEEPEHLLQVDDELAVAMSVIVTNKGATAQPVTIQVNGSTPAGPFPLQYISGTDPTVANTFAKAAVTLQGGSSSNPVTIPPYSVVRVDLVTPAVATLVHGASYQFGSAGAESTGVSVWLRHRTPASRRDDATASHRSRRNDDHDHR